jgi:hypothetical protein
MENKLQEDKPWKIEIHSETNTNGLTNKQLNDVLDVLNDDYTLERQNNFNKKMSDEYDQYPVAKWQNQKVVEIEELFRNSLKYKIDNDKVLVDVNLEITFPDNFTEGDVYQWVQGLHRLVDAHSTLQIDKLMKSFKEGNFDEELSKRERQFLLNLIQSQDWKVKKLKKTNEKI